MRAHEGVGSHPAANAQRVFLPVVEPLWPTAYIHDYDAGLIWFNRFLSDNTPPTGLIGTAPDMMRLAKAILDGGTLDGRRILSPASVSTLLSKHQVEAGASPEREEITASDVRHGIAFFVVRDDGRPYYEHSGGRRGWTALMRIYPGQHLAIVVMGNGTVVPADALADAIRRAALRRPSSPGVRWRPGRPRRARPCRLTARLAWASAAARRRCCRSARGRAGPACHEACLRRLSLLPPR
jgi:CubicO group peptidase (beta-lactamase class C family)